MEFEEHKSVLRDGSKWLRQQDRSFTVSASANGSGNVELKSLTANDALESGEVHPKAPILSHVVVLPSPYHSRIRLDRRFKSQRVCSDTWLVASPPRTSRWVVTSFPVIHGTHSFALYRPPGIVPNAETHRSSPAARCFFAHIFTWPFTNDSQLSAAFHA